LKNFDTDILSSIGRVFLLRVKLNNKYKKYKGYDRVPFNFPNTFFLSFFLILYAVSRGLILLPLP
jgi:hypothetical protein